MTLIFGRYTYAICVIEYHVINVRDSSLSAAMLTASCTRATSQATLLANERI